MRSLYRALGVKPDADAEQIKAAYRSLAKRSHPDMNADDGASGQRFKEIHEAYTALRDPQARAIHDLTLELQRERSRRRRQTTFVTMLATFFLTVVGTLFFFDWQDKAERSAVAQLQAPPLTTAKPYTEAERPAADDGDKPSQRNLASLPGSGAAKAERHRGAPATSSDPKSHEQGKGPRLKGQPPKEISEAADAELPVERLSSERKAPAWPPTTVVATPVKAAPAAWTTYQNVRFGFSLNYPHDVFTVIESERRDGLLLVSHDGHARLRISATQISRGTRLRAYRRKLMKQYGNAVFHRSPLHKTWFALSGSRGGDAFYERVVCSCDGRALHAWQVTYPPAQRAFYEPIIAEIRRSYRRDGEDEVGRCRRNQA